jgi:hypothetical protein
MKLLTLIFLFTVTSLAAKYPAGTNCHTNTECNDNCQDGTWTIMNVQGDYQLVCDPAKDDLTQYYSAYCHKPRSQRFDDIRGTKVVCNKVGGIYYDRHCFFTGKRSAQGDTSSTWTDACRAQELAARFNTHVTARDAATEGYSCDVDKIFPQEKQDFVVQA